jgi:hypothetical protein
VITPFFRSPDPVSVVVDVSDDATVLGTRLADHVG